MAEPELRYVQALIENDQFEDALLYLEHLDHPMAAEWREQLTAARSNLEAAGPKRALEDGEIPSSVWERYMGEARVEGRVGQELVEQERGLAAASHLVRAMPSSVQIMGGIGAITLTVLLLAMPGGPLILFLLAVLIGFYVTQAQEITAFDGTNGVIHRHYEVLDREHYEITARITERTQFASELPPTLHYPPSVSALLSGPLQFANAEQGHAATILQSTICALWAWGVIDLYEITVQHSILGRDVFFSREQFLVPAQNITSFDVDGELERQIMLVLERWTNTHHDAYAAKPWKPGPTFRELVRALRTGGTPFHAQLLETVRNDALGRGLAVRKGWRKKYEITEDGFKALSAEAHNVSVLVQRVAQYHPELVKKLMQGIMSNLEDAEKGDQGEE